MIPRHVPKGSTLAIGAVSIALLASCGGGEKSVDEASNAVRATHSSAHADSSAAVPAAMTAAAPHQAERPASIASVPAIQSAAGNVQRSTDIASPALRPAVDKPLTLSTLVTVASDVLSHVGATPTCASGFIGGTDLDKSEPVTLNGITGATFTDSDLSKWKARALRGPFLVDGDYQPGSPGDWQRILSSASRFLANGEPPVSDANRASSGIGAVAAAFVGRVNEDGPLVAATRDYLVSAVSAPMNDFTSLCYRALNGSAPGGDAWYAQAVWTYRVAITYDLVRARLDMAARLKIENWLRRQAYFFAGQIDRDLASLFPNRLDGDYSVRGFNAAASTSEPMFSKRVDTDGDCVVSAADDAAPQPIYAYVDTSGKFGPRLSHVSQYFNNRRSDLANAFGTIGLILQDDVLVARAERYYMEWLTWSVYPDGSQGELARSGEYCTPKAGLIYGQTNIQSALNLAHRLRVLRGDSGLLNFSTRDGIWGSESPAAGPAKSLALVVDVTLKLVTGELAWHLPEPWRAVQVARPDTLLAKMDSSFMGQGGKLDSFHELGLLMAAESLPALPIRGILMRDQTVTKMPLPGLTGNRVNTGIGVWSDIKGVIPGVYFWAAA